MKLRTVVTATLFCLLPALAHAQTPTTPHATASLREQLMPGAQALRLQAPAVAQQHAARAVSLQPAAYHRGGTGYIIAGGALFVAGLIAGGDAGTLLVVAGAGIGAYGLYLHFR